MFQSVDLYNDCTSSIKSAWRRTVRFIQEYVEHNRTTCPTDTAIIGSIVHVSDHGEISLASGSKFDGHWCGVACEPFLPGQNKIIRTDGYSLVHFEDSLALEDEEGSPVYLSGTDGCATNDGTDMNIGDRLGILGDATIYEGDPLSPNYYPFAYVCLGYVCAPTDLGPAGPL